MDRRGFLRFLGLGAAAAVAPTKAYSFLGGILRPRLALTPKSEIQYVTASDIMTRRQEAMARYAAELGAWQRKAMQEWLDIARYIAPYDERQNT